MSLMYDFKGKTCLITGGASGMGEAFSLAFASCGADVVIADINLEAANHVTKAASGLAGKISAEYLDASSVRSVEKMVENVYKSNEKVDILVNCVGIGAQSKPDESPTDIWDRIMSVNLHGIYYCCARIGEKMIARHKGTIVNIASQAATIVPEKTRPGRLGEYGLFAYCSSKAAIKHLSKALAVTWAPYGIKVNSVSPGYVDTPMTKGPHSDPEVRQMIERKVPIGHIAQPREIVDSVLFLAAEVSDYIVGHDLLVDGGYTCW